MGFFANLFRGSDDPYDKYTSSWLKSSPEEELDEEYESIRQRHCSGDERAMRYLGMIGDEKRRRHKAAHPDDEPGYPVHREHGWYLSNDD